jgi:hypothetical protein
MPGRSYTKDMRVLRIGLLVCLLMLPILVVFGFDLQFNRLQSQLCTNYDRISGGICNDPSVTERERLITTGFYRHIADNFGRERGTSLSFQESLYARGAGNQYDPETYDQYGKVMDRLYAFNRLFAASFAISLLASGAAIALLAQMTIRRLRRKPERPRSSLFKTVERLGQLSLSRIKKL